MSVVTFHFPKNEFSATWEANVNVKSFWIKVLKSI